MSAKDGWLIAPGKEYVRDLAHRHAPPRPYGVGDQLRMDVKSLVSWAFWTAAVAPVVAAAVTGMWWIAAFGVVVLVMNVWTVRARVRFLRDSGVVTGTAGEVRRFMKDQALALLPASGDAPARAVLVPRGLAGHALRRGAGLELEYLVGPHSRTAVELLAIRVNAVGGR